MLLAEAPAIVCAHVVPAPRAAVWRRLADPAWRARWLGITGPGGPDLIDGSGLHQAEPERSLRWRWRRGEQETEVSVELDDVTLPDGAVGCSVTVIEREVAAEPVLRRPVGFRASLEPVSSAS